MTWLAAARKDMRVQGIVSTAGADLAGDAKPRSKILIVEDEYLIALELENRLVDAGFEVVGVAATADEAIKLASAEKPDLAIMDIRLAGARDGVDAAIELFSRFGVRSIFASAHADAATQKRAAAASAIGWLQKPYPADQLIALIQIYCRSVE
jgi:DNA-binding NarL/FixJ family response regulator